MRIVASTGAQAEVGDDVEVAALHVGGHGLGVVGDVDASRQTVDAAVATLGTARGRSAMPHAPSSLAIRPQ